MTAPHSSLSTCSCGDASAHVIMRRHTADGIEICLWENGAITGALGIGLRGVPVARPKTEAAVNLARRTGRLMLGEVCLYDADELSALYIAARKAALSDGLPGTLRAAYRAARDRRALLAFNWTVLSADRDGNATERVARLPRLRWPGVAVWDYCGGPGSSRGRYHLVRETQRGSGTYAETGFVFGTLSALCAHLASL